MKNMDNVLILFSGGIDSTACIHYFLDRGFSPHLLFVDYGQLSSKNEDLASKKISKYYKIPYKKVEVKNKKLHNSGYILGRNALLLTIGLFNFEFNKGLISIGIHRGTNYRDCTLLFINQMQAVFDEYTNGNIIITTPFINFIKPEIFAYCKQNEIPLDLTYSCEIGGEQPCDKCDSCKDLKKLYEIKK